MLVYKDCLDATAPDFDRPAYFEVFNLDDNSLVDNPTEDPISEHNLVPTSAGCIDNIPPFCTGVAKYVFTTTLPINTKGYTIAYERCCRNGGVANVYNSDEFGTAIFVNLTKQAMQACNNSPVFNSDPTNFVCINSTMDIDFTASDVNGDKLRYFLCAPYTAGDQFNPSPPSSGPFTDPPFPNVTYNAGYSAIQPFGINSPISIDSITGKISGIPKTTGLFTIGVCVKEYRGATFLSETIRDFQVKVENCAIKEAHPMPPDDPKKASVKLNDSTYIVCNGKSVQFTNPGSTNITYYWNFGDPTTLRDTSLVGSPIYTFPDTGLYRVQLTIERGKPCLDSGYVYVRVYDPLLIRPTYTPNCQGNALLFKDSSVSAYNDIDSWKWKFTSTDSALTKNASHIYPNPGNFNVSLFVGTAKGCLVQKDTLVTVYAKPRADFSSNNLCYRHNTLFTDASTISLGTITKYNWNFGDGGIDSIKNPSHLYTTFDSFSIQHIVTSNFGCKDTITKKIKMDDTVKLSYTTAPQQLCVGTVVTFTNTSTGGNATGYRWIINNGAPVINQTSTSATFNTSGIFPVLLISTNRCGNDTLRSTITISANPAVNLGPDVLVCNKSTKTITATGTFDSIRWNTNETTASINIDGKKSPIIVTVYKGTCAGKDTINASVQTITPNFTNNFLCYNKPVTFNNTSTVNSGTLTTFDWNYGDGNTDLNIKNPTHTYTVFNNYAIQLIATSDIGCKDTVIKTVKMDTVQHVDFTTAEVVSCQRKTVQFVDLTTGGANNQNTWNIESAVVNTKNASHTFLGTGTYPVKLKVTNRCYTDSLTKSIQIRPRPAIDLGRDTTLCKSQTTVLTVNPGLYDSIRWINGSTASNVTVDGTINPYKINVYLDGCNAEDTINIIAQKFILGFNNTFICLRTPVVFNNTSTINSGTITNYNWNFGDGTTAAIKDPSHAYSVFGPKNIQLIGKSNAGCFDTLNATVNMDDTVMLVVTPVPADICIHSTAQYTNQSSGGFNTTYTWTLNGASAKSDSVATYTYNTAGPQTIKLTSDNRCGQDSIVYKFTTKPLPSVTLDESIVMCPDEIRTIEATGDFDSVFWSTGSTTNPTTIDGNISPVIFTGYKAGCKGFDSIRVILNCDVFSPNGFSPNNDNLNDFFNLIPKNILSYDLRVYDRWGELLFETSDFNKGWDGTYKGQPCLVDSYVYYASGIKKDKTNFSIKGVIVLIR
ncbi:MAG: conserved repeat domain protein [Bacteroidota bacterium]|nr:conserved repeat domain protein [Bacteroidota bacterium]